TMEAGGGAARPEPPSGEGARLEQSQMQLDGPVVLNRSAELESSDAMDIDATPAQALKQTVPPPTQSPAATLTDTVVQVQKQLKRKRASNGPVIAPAEKEALADGCRLELQGLFEYYKEVSGHKMQIDGGGNLSTNAMIGCLLEESNLGLSKLVDEAFEKLKGTEGVSVASVRSSVLLIGQRMMYGQSSPDADVLEDESELSLWCWEVRDLKVLPVRTRGFLSARRTARKKIHERITALHSTLSALESTGAEGQVNELRKVSMKLSKALNLEGIRSMVERVTQKNNIQRGAKDVESTDQSMQEQVILKMQKQSQKETKRQEKEEHQMMKQQKKMQEEALREQKRREKEEAEVKKRQKRQEEEALKEQKRREKEEAEMRKQEKKQQEDALKEQKRREKEEAEMRKQQKKQQEEADKEQKRLEKEAAQLKKQLAIQKQALLMQRLFKSNDSEKPKSGENDSDACSVDPGTTKKEISAATSIIDSSFNLKESWTLEYLQRLQITGWQKLSNYNRSSRWGIRHKPKEAFKELKLQKTSDDMIDEILSAPNEDACHNSGQENEPDKLGNDIDMLPASEVECHVTRNDNSLPTRLIKRKLLQFAKSNRPAYYGTWRKKSAVIRPKCPLMMDPDLDYEIDSDDEWEEGIQVESLLDEKADDASSLPTSQCPEVEEFRTLLRQQKVLNTLTEQALRKSQPLVISNLAHEKADLLTAQDLKGSLKIEQLCLQVLSMRICPGGGVVDVPAIDSSSAASEETNQSNAKSSPAAASSVLDTDLQEIVQVIQSSRDGIHKLVELLHQKFPTVKKTQLNHKVREISDFVDNRWQVRILTHLAAHLNT
uniref:Uncharacterized protein n=1 Tax=Aegilops tauschii subsp. strangulata TaxID=200361 RepID=A0A453LHL4_AEGTS